MLSISRFCSVLLILHFFMQNLNLIQGAVTNQIGNDQASKRIIQDLDCYRMKLVLKSLILRIHRLELEAFGVEKVPFELAEIENWCPGPLNPLAEFNKRNFDEIDRSGFRGFSKKNFDEIDKTGFRGFTG